MQIDAIFLAAGVGSRLKLNYPKQLHLINNKPLMIYSLELIEQIPEIKNIYVTTRSSLMSMYENMFSKYNIKKAICIEGGTTRHISVFNCLKYITTERTLIHVSARPFITTDFIKKLLSYQGKAVVPVTDVPYIIYNTANEEYPPRKDIKYIQLPQIFQANLLKKAHFYARDKNKMDFPDDSSLVLNYLKSNNIKHCEINFVPGLKENFKITYPFDLEVAKLLLQFPVKGGENFEQN